MDNVSGEKQMTFDIVASSVFESAIAFLRDESGDFALKQRFKNAGWLQKLNVKDQSLDKVLQALGDRAFDHINKAIAAVSHLVSILSVESRNTLILTPV
jgi:hypothetical protein